MIAYILLEIPPKMLSNSIVTFFKNLTRKENFDKAFMLNF